jgi:hypothetical protein
MTAATSNRLILHRNWRRSKLLTRWGKHSCPRMGVLGGACKNGGDSWA